jgi:hypothetical protein
LAGIDFRDHQRVLWPNDPRTMIRRLRDPSFDKSAPIAAVPRKMAVLSVTPDKIVVRGCILEFLLVRLVVLERPTLFKLPVRLPVIKRVARRMNTCDHVRKRLVK